ncbi:MAG: hypothetical protein KKA84_13145 [Bacteroidetes bacterium]|nr:hypothetical protein [Bacteroidota bacterium]
MNYVGIRKEDKNIWEKRVPLIPNHIKTLVEKENINFLVESFVERAFTDSEFENAGAKVTDNIDDAKFVFGVKEVPIDKILEDKVYMFFSHTIKGQDYNMPLLQKIIDSKSTLIDYEEIKDDDGKRLVFFGKYAGFAGMIDTLHGIGKRWASFGIKNPFEEIKPAYLYKDLIEAQKKIREVAENIALNGLPAGMNGLVIGITGYGNVSQGVQEILDILPNTEISPYQLLEDKTKLTGIIKVVFKESDLAIPTNPRTKFNLQEYYESPERYKSKFEQYLPFMDVIMNSIYWNEKYPVLVSKEYLKSKEKHRLSIIGDITCDIGGSIEITYKSTESDNSTFVYNHKTDSFKDGYEGEGVAVVAVDNLPAELPTDASVAFSETLNRFIPGIVNADYNNSFLDVDMPPEIKRAVIVYNGKLTPDFEYLNEYLK